MGCDGSVGVDRMGWSLKEVGAFVREKMDIVEM